MKTPYTVATCLALSLGIFSLEVVSVVYAIISILRVRRSIPISRVSIAISSHLSSLKAPNKEAYVTLEDVLLVTVRESIKYSANLRLPTTMSKQEINDIVEGTIIEIGLEDCADRLIGNWYFRDISSGEKKRLSIALEILTRPRLLFLDEPTSGLDSASAFFVIQALRNVTRDGRTIISSIHQPSREVFTLFDDLVLLSGGENVYFGEASKAVKDLHWRDYVKTD